MSISNNPDINLLVIGIVMSTLLLLKGILSQVYKQWLIEALELACYYNVTIFCLAKLFIIIEVTNRNQAVIVYVSGSISLALFVAVAGFHVLTEVCSIEKALKCFCQSKQRNEDVDLRNYSPNCDPQVSQRVPTMSVVDAPTNHGDGEGPFNQLTEPLLTT